MGLYLGTAVIAVAVAIVTNFTGGDAGHTLAQTYANVAFSTGVLPPIIGLMLFTGEWSTRTTMTTFSLTPQRGRIISAKLLAAVALALTAFVFSLAVAAAGVAFGGGSGADTWTLGGQMLGQLALFTTLVMLSGATLGAAILNSPAAIVMYFAAPLAIEVLGLWSVVSDAIAWVSQGATFNRLADGSLLTTSGWWHVLSGTGVWIVLPLAIGVWRIRRHDIA